MSSFLHHPTSRLYRPANIGYSSVYQSTPSQGSTQNRKLAILGQGIMQFCNSATEKCKSATATKLFNSATKIRATGL